MNKFSGIVGYVTTEETSPGVWTENKVEKQYYGDINRNIKRNEEETKINNDIAVNMEISVVADPYALENYMYIKYVEYMNTLWRVSSVDIRYPRLVINIGGVYHEQKS
ncbi:MAG: hypothetical protein HUJ78_00075 [Mogibacterium sp.]|nr:hypothetical protein [Mogibacterium sp.]